MKYRHKTVEKKNMPKKHDSERNFVSRGTKNAAGNYFIKNEILTTGHFIFLPSMIYA